MREMVFRVLTEIRPDIDFDTETGLVSEGILESFDLLTIIASLQDEAGIEISNREISADNFDSLDAMVRMVERLSKS